MRSVWQGEVSRRQFSRTQRPRTLRHRLDLFRLGAGVHIGISCGPRRSQRGWGKRGLLGALGRRWARRWRRRERWTCRPQRIRGLHLIFARFGRWREIRRRSWFCGGRGPLPEIHFCRDAPGCKFFRLRLRYRNGRIVRRGILRSQTKRECHARGGLVNRAARLQWGGHGCIRSADCRSRDLATNWREPGKTSDSRRDSGFRRRGSLRGSSGGQFWCR